MKKLMRGALAGVLILLIQLPLCAAETNALKPNIVFIIIDDLGWRDLSFMGSSFYESPAIDKLASEGLSFSHAQRKLIQDWMT